MDRFCYFKVSLFRSFERKLSSFFFFCSFLVMMCHLHKEKLAQVSTFVRLFYVLQEKMLFAFAHDDKVKEQK